MKYITFIFAFYLIGMIAWPCRDAFNECATPLTKVQADSHSHKSDSNDVCSPFCSCSCCHTTTTDVKFNPTKVKERKQIVDIKFSLNNSPLVSNYYGNIWQPPKIA